MLPKLEPMFTKEEIQRRVDELGKKITADYEDKDLLCLGILKGSVPFFTHLIQAIDLPITTDYICCSSYGNKTASSGEVKMVLDLGGPIKDKHVLIVEDIIDTGLTISYLIENLKMRKPASIRVATLLLKPDSLKNSVTVDYTGFEVGNEFVVGYGLDYAEKYRNLPYIAVLPPELIK